ncbi:MAG TPA: ABC transporter substrate-binding protein [Burkholderiales bacterium]|nr:ABC transporter substrate-binding protein [Burkholderiales bacterium]
MRHAKLTLLVLAATAICGHALSADKKYGPGVTDTEITLGQTMPYSGPASAYSTIGKSELAYFEMINQHGGVNGRKIRLISLDDGYSPPKTVEQVRKLVEQEAVLAIFSPLGTPPNTAIHKYLNAKQVPQILLHSSANKWNDPANFPWTMAWPPNSQTETQFYARYLLEKRPNAKVAALYQNDDYGKDLLKGLRDALGTKADQMIVATASYEVTDPTIDSQIVSLQASGADTFFNFVTPKFGAQSIRKVYDIGWKPLQFVAFPASSVGAVLTPAGPEKAVGLITAGFVKDPADPRWKTDPAFQEWLAWMKKYYPEGDVTDQLNVWGYLTAQVMAHILAQCGDDLTRENVMRQATNLKNFESPLYLPGIKLSNSPTDYRLIRQIHLMRFDGKKWVPLGDLQGG